MVHAGNPIGAGSDREFGRLSGNVTGTISLLPELGGKQVE
jgi:hypothetical protein